MSEGIETLISEAPKPTKAQLLKAYLDELNVTFKVLQLFEDGKCVGTELRLIDRPVEQPLGPISE
jgi:hypothetical protein